MDDRKNPPDVPYFVHENETVRLERANRRLWMLCGALVFALMAAGLRGWRRFIREKFLWNLIIRKYCGESTNGYTMRETGGF